MKKVAFIASVSGHIQCFHIPYLKYFKEKGYETYVVTRDEETIDYCDKHIAVPFERSPFSKSTFIAYRKLKKVIEKENFDMIHCHTPVAAFLTRLAAKKVRKKGTKVIYTAHGFHFFKGAPLINWLIYFTVEWIGSFFTDALITMNKEDYDIADKYLHAKKTFFVHGVGVDICKFKKSDKTREEKLNELKIPTDSTVILSVGELSKRKNHEVILKAISKIKGKNIYYCIAGIGEKYEYLKELAKELNISDRFILLGFRKDINELLSCLDIFCFPSLHEGLPVSVMEAMSVGIPCIVSNVRGNNDLIDDNKGGFLVSTRSVEEFKDKIIFFMNNKDVNKEFEIYNKEKIKNYALETVLEEMIKIYEEQENEL